MLDLQHLWSDTYAHMSVILVTYHSLTHSVLSGPPGTYTAGELFFITHNHFFLNCSLIPATMDILEVNQGMTSSVSIDILLSLNLQKLSSGNFG